jgi:hypothetical protein
MASKQGRSATHLTRCTMRQQHGAPIAACDTRLPGRVQQGSRPAVADCAADFFFSTDNGRDARRSFSQRGRLQLQLADDRGSGNIAGLFGWKYCKMIAQMQRKTRRNLGVARAGAGNSGGGPLQSGYSSSAIKLLMLLLQRTKTTELQMEARGLAASADWTHHGGETDA